MTKQNRSMDSKTRDEIIRRCEILKYMGDDGISSIYYELNDKELMEDCGWVLDKAHDDLFKLELKLVPREEN